MTFLALVIGILTAIFCLSLASFAWQDIVIGAVLATALVAIHRRYLFPRSLPGGPYLARLLLILPRLIAYLVVDILKGTWQVASFVVGLRTLEHPGIVKIPLGNHTPASVGTASLLLTISPGSFLVDIDWDERAMLVHYMDASNPAQLRADIDKYFRLWEAGAHQTLPTVADRDPGEPPDA
jgi:multisubunit Na+/H+ antiporter MnhE subunit